MNLALGNDVADSGVLALPSIASGASSSSAAGDPVDPFARAKSKRKQDIETRSQEKDTSMMRFFKSKRAKVD